MSISKIKKIRHKWKIEEYKNGVWDILHCQNRDDQYRISNDEEDNGNLYITTKHNFIDESYTGKCPNCRVRVPKRILFLAMLLAS